LGDVSRAQRNIQWIEKFCRVPEGKDIGKPVKLRLWQRRIVRGIYDEEDLSRSVIIPLGRKNGKTTLAACLTLLHTAGPEAIPNSQIYSTAQSKDQAALLYELCAKMVRMSAILYENILLRDTMKELFCPGLNTTYDALSAEPRTAFGRSTAFVIHDELGQVRGPRYPLYDSIETSMGAHIQPISIVISTQAATDADLLSLLIDDAKRGIDKTIKVYEWTAPLDDPPFAIKTIKKANPAFGDFLSKKEVMRTAMKAKRNPADEASYRNLILNQRVNVHQPYVTHELWKGNGRKPMKDFAGKRVFAGLDLSESRDLTALVLVVEEKDEFHVDARFWLPANALADRAMHDRQPYDLWHQQGYLMTCPGNTVDYAYVADYMRQLFDRLDIVKVGFDRYNWKHFKRWLEYAGFSEKEIEDHFEEVSQNYAAMSPSLRDMDEILYNHKMRHGNHPVLGMCAMNSVIQEDPQGNRKLTKMSQTARIDGMVALVMATAMAGTYKAEPPKTSIYSNPNLWESPNA